MHRTRIEESWLLGQAHCECGETPRYKGSQKRTIQTWVGTVKVQRGYFHCGRCGKGRYPLDEALGIPPRAHFSDGLQQGVCLLGVQLPFERASHTFEVLTGITISPREVERITEERGLALDKQLAEEKQSLLSGEMSSGSGSSSSSGSGSGSGVWTATLDAGRVRYEDGWHDTKAGVVFRAEPKFNEQGEVEGAEASKGSQSYVAEVGSMEAAGERLSAEATRRGIGADEMVVCLGDGASSNWVQFDLHFPNRVEVLDWYHAMEHLWQVGNGIFGQGTPQAVGWVKQWEKELWEGRVEEVIGALHTQSKREGAEGEVAREQIHYFETNKERMRYCEYRVAGYPIGSGTVEVPANS
jgi:hypothetical protein